MIKVLTVIYFASIALAAPNSGYNYQQPQSLAKQTYRPSPSVGSIGIYSGQQSLPLTSINIQPQALPVKHNYVAPAPALQPIEVSNSGPQFTAQASTQFIASSQQYAAPVQQPAVYAPNFSTVSSAQSQYNNQVQQQTIVSKDIYIHSAPEETEEINTEQSVEASPIRKNYRIVFIKAPSQNIRLNMNSFKRTQAANEEKTVIYVLSKKPDITNIQNQLTAVQSEQKVSKPEVYFIKYKTQEEANRAQQEIQAQYDALGGSTRISDEGIAPVTSVIGGSALNIGSAGSAVGSAAIGGSSFTSNTNFAESASNNQLQFAQATGNNQQSFQGNRASASSVSFGIEAPGTKYLPAKKK